MTGAGRLAARAAQRAGAGLVTVAAPASAYPIYAESLESVIIKPCDDSKDWRTLVDDKHEPALLIGPGLGRDPFHEDEVLEALSVQRPTVVDADALTLFADKPETLFAHLHSLCVLTPHEGEFSRLFGTLPGDKSSRTMKAARRAGCTVLLKGAETIIGSPDIPLICNKNAPPWLATAGSGDVLAGIVLGLITQKMPVFYAAAAAAWIHGRAAALFGPGLIAEDLIPQIPQVLQEILAVSSST